MKSVKTEFILTGEPMSITRLTILQMKLNPKEKKYIFIISMERLLIQLIMFAFVFKEKKC